MSELQEIRKQASLKSEGSSSDIILETIISQIDNLNLTEQPQIIDIGCGQGELLNRLKEKFPESNFTGVDYSDFDFTKTFNFFTYDCNNDFDDSFETYDLVVSSEVIEHLENPRHYLRQVNKITKSQGHIVLSTPNPASITSTVSLLLRGYHSAFGPRDYPAHITAILPSDLKNMTSEMSDFNLKGLYYVPNGRIPSTKLGWQQLFPFLKGRLFSENYILVIQKS